MISRDFKRFPQAKLSGYSATVQLRMSADERFTRLIKEIDELSVLNESLAIAISNAFNRDREKIAIKNQWMKAVYEKLDTLAVLVELMANGDEILVLATGFDLYKKPSTLTQLLAPTALVVVNSLVSGSIKASWKEQAGAINYGILYQMDGEAEWRNGTYTTSKEVVPSNFQSGTIVWVKVYAMGTREIKSDASDPVSVVVI
jgi:hypothetical protein